MRVQSVPALQEFHEAFFEEATEHVAAVEAGLRHVEAGATDAETLNAVFRAVHSVKGLAATLGFGEIATFTHEFESVLDRVRSGAVQPTSEVTQMLHRANGTLRDLLSASRTEGATPQESATIRVSTEKLDEIVALVGDVTITQALVSRLVGGGDSARSSELRDALTSLDRCTRELQDRVRSVRLLPVAAVFHRFPRLVRDAATKLGKQVRLELIGEETELDAGTIERIGDPLTHLVRNAVDHGLETPAERLSAGKDATGTVTLRVFHEGDGVVIQIDDDGRGLNTARIRERAIERNLIGGNDALDDDAIHQIIFAPGFSTVTEVSDLSGRGVGMDVVKRSIEALNGTVSLASAPGRGSRVRLRLPLTQRTALVTEL